MTTTLCPIETPEDGWREVCFACEIDEENGLCPCGMDYSTDCLAPGPTEDGIEYKEVNEILYGRRILQ